MGAIRQGLSKRCRESSIMEAKEWDSCTQVHISDDTRGVDGDK